jgi:TetR/AcrR family transcriptional repressor of nem operon
MSSVRGRPREFDRDEILNRAIDLFWQRGYEATPISELVQELGIGRQSLYLAFGNKRQLFEEALDRYAEMEIGPILVQLRAPGSPLDNVRSVLLFLQKRASSNDFKGCMIGHAAGEFGTRDPELSRHLARTFQRLEDAFSNALTRARDAGELSADRNPRALARLLVTTIQGVALWGPARRSPAYVRDVVAGLLELLN